MLLKIYLRVLMKNINRDAQIYAYISSCINENGYSPTVRDIQTALEIKSTSTVHASLARLERDGYVQKEQGKSRTLRLDAPAIKNAEHTVKIPLLGHVTAGQPIFADENIEDYIEFALPENETKYNKYFALHVKGKSMINAGILDGDIIIVRKSDYAENGEIVVAGIGDDATVKRFFREEGHFRLQPENSEMKPIIADEVYIIGKVVASVRYY